MRFLLPLGLPVCLGLSACGTSSSSVPIPPGLLASTRPGPETPCPTLGFDGAGAAGASVTTYTRCGFTVTATTRNWSVWTGYGHPPPFIGFMSAAGDTTTAAIRVTAAAGTFTFKSVDVYSSTTPIPYVIEGSLDSAQVFSLRTTQGNTFGDFATISNPQPDAPVDTLVIRLWNPAAPCCDNPTGLDDVVLR